MTNWVKMKQLVDACEGLAAIREHHWLPSHQVEAIAHILQHDLVDWVSAEVWQQWELAGTDLVFLGKQTFQEWLAGKTLHDLMADAEAAAAAIRTAHLTVNDESPLGLAWFMWDLGMKLAQPGEPKVLFALVSIDEDAHTIRCK